MKKNICRYYWEGKYETIFFKKNWMTCKATDPRVFDLKINDARWWPYAKIESPHGNRTRDHSLMKGVLCQYASNLMKYFDFLPMKMTTLWFIWNFGRRASSKIWRRASSKFWKCALKSLHNIYFFGWKKIAEDSNCTPKKEDLNKEANPQFPRLNFKVSLFLSFLPLEPELAHSAAALAGQEHGGESSSSKQAHGLHRVRQHQQTREEPVALSIRRNK